MKTLEKLDYSSQVLFGRTQEVATLRKSYGQIAGDSAAVFVRGVSGCGKTRVVETLKPIVERDGGFFLSGKFDKFHQGDAYSVLVEAFAGLGDLKYSDKLQDSLRGSLREEAPLLFQMVPSLQKAVYGVSATSLLGTVTTKTGWGFELLKILLRNFLKELCRFHKIVLFMDDLQWSDRSYMDLISGCLNDPELKNFLFVGAYRSNELISLHFLYNHIQDLENLDCSATISVTDLDPNACNQIISGLLHLEPVSTEGLSRIVHKRTSGNAFFVLQFLQMLERVNLLSYSLMRRKWEFDLAKIEGETSLADNLVDVVVGKIRQLPLQAQDALKIAACLGDRFDPWMVAHLLQEIPTERSSDVDEHDLQVTLEQCSEEGLLNVVISNLQDSKDKRVFKFSHDKIQQASYSLIPDSEKPSVHLQLGRIFQALLESSSDVPISRDLLLLITAGQLNRGKALIRDRSERFELAKINLEAAKKVRAKSAFFPASEFVDRALDLLDESNWRDERAVSVLGETKWTVKYELSLEALTMGAELDYSCGKGERCKDRVEEILREAKTLQEKLRAYFTLMDLHTIQRNHAAALETGYDLLRQLGVKLPKRVSLLNVIFELVPTLRMASDLSDIDLLSIPMTDNENTIARIKILQSLLSPAYWLDRMNDFAYMAVIMMKMHMKEGMTNASGAIFSSFGGICTSVGMLEKGGRFGRLGQQLNRTIGNKSYMSKSMVQYYAFTFCIKNSYYLSLDPWLDAHRIGMQVGDLDHSFIAAYSYVVAYYFSGLPLSSIDKDGKMFSMRMLEYTCEQYQTLTMLQIYHQGALNLMGRCKTSPTHLEGEAITDLDAVLYSGCAMDKVRTLQAHSSISMQLAYYFRDSKLAMKAAKKNESFRDSEWPAVNALIYPFFRALVWIEAARSQPRPYSRRASKCIRKLEKGTKQGMVNVHHMYLIAKAERMTLKKKIAQATVKAAFDKAISVSIRCGFTQNAALANELAGRFFMREGDSDWGVFYLMAAAELYHEWDAVGKVDHLKKEFDLKAKSKGRRHSTALKGRSRFAETDQAGKHQGNDAPDSLWSWARGSADGSADGSAEGSR